MATRTTIDTSTSRPVARVMGGGVLYDDVSVDLSVTFSPGDESVAREILDAAHRRAVAELEAVTR